MKELQEAAMCYFCDSYFFGSGWMSMLQKHMDDNHDGWRNFSGRSIYSMGIPIMIKDENDR